MLGKVFLNFYKIHVRPEANRNVIRIRGKKLVLERIGKKYGYFMMLNLCHKNYIAVEQLHVTRR